MEDVLIMDSGYSRHMTGHRKWFSSLNPVSTKEYITFGDNGQGKVMGVGSVSLSAKLSLREVAFVRNLGFNLVSVSQLLDEGFEVFRVDLTSVSGPARFLVASPSADIWEWHRRLGHLSFDLLVRLRPPIRFSWVFFMEFKDEAFGFVRDLVLRLRNESHKAMRAIRSDNGGEFRNSRFENFCRDLGLERQFSSPYTPPQNGDVERKNRTLVEMARTMLDEHRTPRRFWAEAVNTACYIANRIFLCFVLKKAGHLDKFESRYLDGIFLGYASSSRAFRVWILEAKQVVETCDDEEGTPIFEDEEGAVNDGFKLQQMDVKSAFPNGFIEEKVYVRQPPGFESARFLDRVYKLRKALYGPKQAPRAWYARLKSFLLQSGFVMGSVDKTLFLLSRGGDTLIVQIYVDDIIFGGSSHALVSSFAEQMSREFEMSLMGELQFFLGLQIKQGLEGTFVHQAKYTREILKKFNMGDSKPMTTSMSTNTALHADEDGEAVY
ncbi:hypothetical protein U9M48_008346 [Paspalum notatum var. saurae]|uniref:Integrase catalytic domain-containing protein n=1 Tax=Paspalum notatum var. saurae TaxID=547442 RepID=A0AAQ3SNW7_PASNO